MHQSFHQSGIERVSTPGSLQALFKPLETQQQLTDFEETEEASPDPWDRHTLTKVLKEAPGIYIKLLYLTQPSRFRQAEVELPLGHILYQNFRESISINNIVVRREFQRRGFGEHMVEFVKRQLHPEYRQKIDVVINETNRGALEFFKALRFQATQLVPELFDDYDGIEMVYDTHS